MLVDAFPGGATRPELSRDGRTLAFVRRVRDKEALVLKYVVVLSSSNLIHADTMASSETWRLAHFTTPGTALLTISDPSLHPWAPTPPSHSRPLMMRS